MVVGPALPSTALVASHASGLNWDDTVIVTELGRMLPQIAAACWNTNSRCWPSVVPGLPPTGARAVASLNPSPAPSLFTIVIVAASAPWKWRSARTARPATHD